MTVPSNQHESFGYLAALSAQLGSDITPDCDLEARFSNLLYGCHEATEDLAKIAKLVRRLETVLNAPSPPVCQARTCDEQPDT